MSQKKKSSGKGAPAVGAFISFGEVSSTSASSFDATATSRTTSNGAGRGDLQPVYTGFDTDLTVVSKKLLKKDSTTKIKAFKELIILLNRSDKLSYIPGFIPYFVYVYLRLSLDNDRKLRELLNIALLSIITNAEKGEEKKVVGPYMKVIIGHLWVNASDSCSEVARAALKAFNQAIPADKRNQRLVALSPFILKHVSRNLSSKPETISDMSQSTPDEAEDRYERVIVASITSIGHLAKFLTIEENVLLIQGGEEAGEGSWVGYREIFNEKFWTSICLDKNILIRRAAYDLISMMCTEAKGAIHSTVSKNALSIGKLSNIFCQFLSEKNAQNVPPMFLAFLSFLKCFPACMSHISLEQQLVPRLQSLIESSPECTLQYLLPIFGAIPSEFIAMYVAADSGTTAAATTAAATAAVPSSGTDAAVSNQSTHDTTGIPPSLSPDGSLSAPVTLRTGAVRSNKSLTGLLLHLRGMVEQRTFPKDLLVSADLCMLESSTLFLLRRTSATAAAGAGATGGDIAKENVEEEEKGEKEGRREGKEKGKGKKGRGSQEELRTSGVQEDSTETEVEIEDCESIEEAAKRLCALIVDSIVLIITATANQSPSARTDKSSTYITTYPPYTAMCRVLIQLQRASTLAINLTPAQWGLFLWAPLASALDMVTHTHLLSTVVFENNENEVEEYIGIDGDGEEHVITEYHSADMEVVGVTDGQTDGQVIEIESRGGKKNNRTKKQRQRVSDEEASRLLAAISAHSILTKVVVNVISVITTAVAATATAVDLCFVLVEAISTRLTLLTTNTTNTTNNTNTNTTITGYADVSRVAQSALRSALTAQFICDLRTVSPASSSSSSSSFSLSASISLVDFDSSVLSITESEGESTAEGMVSGSVDVLLSDWLTTICYVLQLKNDVIHILLVDKLSQLYSAFLSSMGVVLRGEGTDACLAVLTHCLRANSLLSLNTALSSDLCSSILQSKNVESAKGLGLSSSPSSLSSSASVSMILDTLASSVLTHNVGVTSDRISTGEYNNEDGVRNTDEGDGIYGVNTPWSAALMMEKSSLSDRVRFASLYALSEGGLTECDVGLTGSTGGGGCGGSTLSRARSSWRESRSKMGMWVVLSVIYQRLSKASHCNDTIGEGKGKSMGGTKEGGETDEENLPSELPEMLLSAFFQRKDVYRSKSNTGNANVSALQVITSWEDAKNILLPLLPILTQRMFSQCVIESLSLRNMFSGNSRIGDRGDRGREEISGGEEKEEGKGEEDSMKVNGELSFMPRKWARHTSGMIALAAAGLCVDSEVDSLSVSNLSVHSDSGRDVERKGAQGGEGVAGQRHPADGMYSISRVISAVGLGDASCWSALTQTAYALSPSLSQSTGTSGVSGISADNVNISGNRGDKGDGVESVVAFLNRAEYLLHSLLHLDELWAIQRNGRDKGGAEGQWLCFASDARLCEEFLVSLLTVESLCGAVNSSVIVSACGDGVMALLESVRAACKESFAVCRSVLRAASPSSRSYVAMQLLDRAYEATSSSLAPRSGTTLTALSTPSTVHPDGTKSIYTAHTAAVIATVAQHVLSVCLTDTNIHTPHGRKKMHNCLPKLLRAQSVHAANVPEKGTTVWYLQHKAVRTYDSLCKYSEDNDNDGVRTHRTLRQIETLEGKLVGIHKEGKEDPFYTVSLETPIHGSAGNTVREVQTDGYRILLSCPSSSLLGEYLLYVTEAAVSTYDEPDRTYMMDTVETYTVEKVTDAATPTRDSNPHSDTLCTNDLLVDEAVVVWLDTVLSDIVTRSPIYHRHINTTQKSVSNNSLQLDVACSILKAICNQLILLDKLQTETESSSNFADSQHNITGISAAAATVNNYNSNINEISSQNNTNKGLSKSKTNMLNLRIISTQVLSRYRGAVIYLLSADAIRETSRVRTGLSLLNALLTPMGAGCGLWLPEVLKLITQVVKGIKQSGSLVISKEEKKGLLSSVCLSLAGLLRVCGGRWKGAREVSGEAMMTALPLLTGEYCDLSVSAVCLFRHMLSERLPLDSSFLPHQKEKGVGGSKKVEGGLSVQGQWVGGTLAGATPAAVAAAQRLAAAEEGVLSEWETLGLSLCLRSMTDSSTSQEGVTGEGGVTGVRGIAEGQGIDSSNNSNSNSGSSVSSIQDNAAIAVHALLLRRTREAGGTIILTALSPSPSPDIETQGLSVLTNEEGQLAGEVGGNSAIENRQNSSVKSDLAEKLMDTVSCPSMKEDSNASNSNLVRLMAAKVLDVWYCGGGGISPELLATQDVPTEGEEDAGEGGEEAVEQGIHEEEEEELKRCEEAFCSLMGNSAAEEIFHRLKCSGSSSKKMGGARRGKKKVYKQVEERQVVAKGTFLPVADKGEEVEEEDDEEEEEGEAGLDEVEKEGEKEGEKGGATDLSSAYSKDTAGTLLQWLLCLQRIDALSGHCFSMRARCGSYLKKTGSLKRAMMLFMRLVPDLVKQRDLPNALQRLEGLDSREEISKLAAYCLFRTACVLPAMVRSFWSDDCSRLSKQILSEFVSLRVRSSLLAREITLIDIAGKAGRWDPEELQVRGSSVSGEITATFCREDTKIELKITLPPTYPLCNVEVECTGKSGVKDGRWRRWVLQIVQLMASQDGSVIDAALLWKSNLEKEFDGVEPCPICYCILHPKTFSLPALTCPTCNNKFHSTCLYTWFKSSGKSKCVICQQPIFH